jgi:hypothetical protein
MTFLKEDSFLVERLSLILGRLVRLIGGLISFGRPFGDDADYLGKTRVVISSGNREGFSSDTNFDRLVPCRRCLVGIM